MVMSAMVRDEYWVRSYLGEALVKQSLISKWTLFSALASSRRQGKRLGEYLVEEELVSRVDVTAILRRQLTAFLIRHKFLSEDELLLTLAVSRVRGKRLNKVLIEEELVSPYALATAISSYFQIPLVDLDEQDSQPEAVWLAHGDLALHYGLMPLYVRSDKLHVAMAEPYDLVALGRLEKSAGQSIVPYAALETQLEERIKRTYTGMPSRQDESNLVVNLVGTY